MLSLRKPNVLEKLPSFEQRGQRLQLHKYVCMLCATAIIYYIINSAYAFIKSTNMIYRNCVYQGDVYYINQIFQRHILIPQAFEVAIYVPIKVCNCNQYSFKYL